MWIIGHGPWCTFLSSPADLLYALNHRTLQQFWGANSNSFLRNKERGRVTLLLMSHLEDKSFALQFCALSTSPCCLFWGNHVVFFLSFFFLSHLHRDTYNDHWWNSDRFERKWLKTHHLILLIMNHSFRCVPLLCPHTWVNVCVPYICKASQPAKLYLWTPAFMANRGKDIDSDYNGECAGGSVLVLWEDFPNHSFSHKL